MKIHATFFSDDPFTLGLMYKEGEKRVVVRIEHPFTPEAMIEAIEQLRERMGVHPEIVEFEDLIKLLTRTLGNSP